jgi:hypothetical protein
MIMIYAETALPRINMAIIPSMALLLQLKGLHLITRSRLG